MQRVKRRTFSGVVCEQEVYNVPDRIKSLEKAEPRPRFKNEEERELHRIGISRRKHARLINENYGPTSLYSTLTLDNESEVHTFDEARRIRDLYRPAPEIPRARREDQYLHGPRQDDFPYTFSHDFRGRLGKLIRDLWGLGDVLRIEHLREHNYYNGVDYGRDYTGLANYLFRPLDAGAGRPPLETDEEPQAPGARGADRRKTELLDDAPSSPAERLCFSRE